MGWMDGVSHILRAGVSGGAPMLRRLFLVAVIAGLLVGGCSQSDDATSDETATTATAPTTTTTIAPTTVAETQAAMVTEWELVYATWEEGPLTLDMYAPVESAGAPIVMYFPGRMEFTAPPVLVGGLVEEGALVFVVRYPLVASPSTLEFVDRVLGYHGAGARAVAEGVACAINFARVRASELGSDDPVVALTGFSGGGGVAAYVALFGADLEARWDEFAAAGGPPRQVECEVIDGSTHVDALVGMAGPYDLFVPIYDGKYGRAYQQERDPELQEFLSSSIGAYPDLKVRLIHGESDEVVPYTNSVGFAAMLTDAGYDVGEVIAFDGGHTEPTELVIPTVMELIGP